MELIVKSFFIFFSPQLVFYTGALLKYVPLRFETSFRQTQITGDDLRYTEPLRLIEIIIPYHSRKVKSFSR
jgi:hypothetical protein